MSLYLKHVEGQRRETGSRSPRTLVSRFSLSLSRFSVSLSGDSDLVFTIFLFSLSIFPCLLGSSRETGT